VAVVLDRDGRRSLAEVVPSVGGPRLAPLPGPAAGRDGGLRDPVWEGETALWVVARLEQRAGERRDLARTASWRIDLRPGGHGGEAVAVAAPRGGVVDHTVGLVAARRAGGPVLVRPLQRPFDEGGNATGGDGHRPERPMDDPSTASAPGAFDDRARGPHATSAFRPYDPRTRLRLLGWLPEVSGGGVGVRALAVDPARRLSVEAMAGVAPGAEGPLGPAWLGVGVRVGDAGPVATPAPPAPATASLRFGVLPVRPHREAPLGPRARLDVGAEAIVAGEPRVRLGGDASLQLLKGTPRLGARLRLTAADGVADPWGVPRRGWAVAATWRSDPLPDGRTSGAWLAGAVWRPIAGEVPLTLRSDVRVGWRPPPPAPAAVWGDAVLTGRTEVAWTVPVRARMADGRWAFERVRLAPAARLGATRDDDGAWGAAAGVEATLAADLVLGYGAPTTVALQGGLAWDGAGCPGGWLRLAAPGLP
jgi:hypothetical protein